jgi:hypothetical protein
MTKVIFVCGESNSGKDTFAALYKIAKYYNENPEQEDLSDLASQIKHINNFSKIKDYAFADKLKEMYSKKFNVPLVYLYTNKLKDEYRDSLIKYADSIRENDPLFAINHIKSIVDSSNDDTIIITDLRLPLEYEYAKSIKDALIVSIVRPGFKKKNNHETETFIDSIIPHIMIINDGSIHDYYNAVKDLVL